MSCFVSPTPSGGSSNECYLPVAVAATAAASEVLTMKDLKKDDLIFVPGALDDYDSQNTEILVTFYGSDLNLLGGITYNNPGHDGSVIRVKNDVASSYIQPSSGSCVVAVCRKVKAPLVETEIQGTDDTFESVVDMDRFEFFTATPTDLSKARVTFSNDASVAPGNVGYFAQAWARGSSLHTRILVPRTYLNLFDVHPVSMSSALQRLKCFW